MKFWNPIDDVDGQRVTIDRVIDGQLHRRIYVASFNVAANVHIRMIRSVVGESMNQPGIAVEVENNRLVACKQTVEVAIT